MEILKAAIRTKKGFLYPSLEVVAKLALNVETVEQGVVYTLPGGDSVRSWCSQTLPPDADDGDSCYIESSLLPGGAWFVFSDDGWTQVMSLMINNRQVFAFHGLDEVNGDQKVTLAVPIDIDDTLRIQYAQATHPDLLIAMITFEKVVCEAIATGHDIDVGFAHAEVKLS